MVNLSSVDLNRLLVLHTVLETRSVTAAAGTLNVTPSAVSNALARLRHTFGDRLLVRSGRRLVPTPWAIALAPKLAEAVAAVSRVVEAKTAFDPRTSTRTFSLACSDAEQISELPRLASLAAAKLPRARLRVMSVDELESSGGLSSGDADVAIAPAHPTEPGVRAADLYSEDAVFIVRRNHPTVRRKLTAKLFNETRHIDILLALGRGGIGHRAAEAFLAQHNLHRDIAVTVPSFTAAAVVASETDWMTGMPRRLAERFAKQMPLQIVASPLPPMTFRMQMFWHDRTDADEGAAFFRALVREAISKGRR